MAPFVNSAVLLSWMGIYGATELEFARPVIDFCLMVFNIAPYVEQSILGLDIAHTLGSAKLRLSAFLDSLLL